MAVQKERPMSSISIMTLDELRNRSYHDTGFKWVEQESDFYFKVEAPDDTADESVNRSIVKNLESEMHRTLRATSALMNGHGKQLVRSTKTGLNRKSHQKLLPWLPWPGSVIAFVASGLTGELEKALDLNKPLVGQKAEDLNVALGQIVVTQFRLPRIDVTPPALIRYATRGISLSDLILRFPSATLIPITTFELISLEFEPGSIWPKAKVRKRILAATMAILGFGALETQLSGYMDRQRQESKFVQTVQNAATGPAVGYCGDRFSYDKLRALREDALDYNAKGISAPEKSCIVAEEQVALNLALNIKLPIDGIPGKRTLAAEKQFGEDNKVPGKNSNEMFRGRLLLQFKPPAEK
jgi:hypothetical protein